MDIKTRSLLKIHTAVLLFGLTGVFGKYISTPAAYITLGRVFFASASIFVLFKIRGVDTKLSSVSDMFFICLTGAILAFHWTAFYQSVKVSTVAIALLTFSAYPAFVTFSEPVIFHEKLKMTDIICAFVIIFGVLLIVPEFSLSNNMTIGLLWGMAGSFTFAVMSLMNRKFASHYSGSIIALYEQGTATVVLLPMLFLLPLPMVTAADWGLLALLGVVFTGWAHSLFIGGMKAVRAQTAGIIASLESVYGIFLAAVLLGEIPSLKELFGGALILCAACFSTMMSAREKQPQDNPIREETSPN